MNKNKIFVALVVIIVIIGGYFFPTSKTVVERVTEKLGAVSTLDGVDNPYVSINGVKTAYVSQGLTATSSTICSIKNPYQATTSVIALSLRITSGILGANSISVSTSTDTYSTSTQFFVLDRSIASAATDSFGWKANVGTTTNVRLMSSSANGEVLAKVGPNEYVNFRLATTTGAGVLAAYYGGQCSIEFWQL